MQQMVNGDGDDSGGADSDDDDDAPGGLEADGDGKMHVKAGLHCEAVNAGLSAKWQAPTPLSRLISLCAIS